MDVYTLTLTDKDGTIVGLYSVYKRKDIKGLSDNELEDLFDSSPHEVLEDSELPESIKYDLLDNMRR